MKTTQALSFGVAVALLAACATLPGPDEGNRTLLVIPVKTGAGDFGIDRHFLLKESDVRLHLPPRPGICCFDKLPPGTYTIDRVTIAMAGGTGGTTLVGGPQQTYSITPMTFTLKAGHITIFPATMMLTEKNPQPNYSVETAEWIPTNRAEVLAKLSKRDNFELWKIAE